MQVPFLNLQPQHQALRTEVLAALAATYDATLMWKILKKLSVLPSVMRERWG